MKINILLFLAIMAGVPGFAVISIAEQTAKAYSGGQAVTSEGGTRVHWGLNESLKNCSPCHNNKSKRNPPDKTDLVAKVPGLCHTCHEEYVTERGWVHGPVATGECLLCHNPHNTNDESLLTKPIPELCYDCHEPKSLQLIANHTDQSYASCNVCHTGHVSECRILLKNNFLNADEGLIYISKYTSSYRSPKFVDSGSSLAGIEGLEVVSTVDGAELLSLYGVDVGLVKTEVEQQLKQNGIEIMNSEEQDARKPVLRVYLRLMEVPTFRGTGQIRALSGSFNISLQQTVELLPTAGDERKRYCSATTWDTGAILIWGTSQIEGGLKEAVEVLVGRFIKDYQSANPSGKIVAAVR